VSCEPNQCAPTQIHMMLRPDGVGVSMLWQTFGTSNTNTVWLGTTSGKYTIIANSTRQQSITGSDTGYSILFDHLVDVPNLPPSTRFYYRVGDATDGVSDEHSFVTGPPPQRKKAAGLQSRVVIYGDMGLANSLQTIQLVENIISNKSTPVDFIMHVGDLSYADDYAAFMYERVWEQYFFNMRKILATTPYMMCPGNHEYSCEHDGCRDETSGFSTYIMRFALPVNTYAGNTPMWYSWNRGNVHWIATSTETDYPDAFFPTQFGDQLKWLDADLAAANSPAERALRPWIIVTGHRPLYSNAHGFCKCDGSGNTCWPYDESAKVSRAFEPLFDKYKVDIAFSGHVHSYSRTYGVANNGTYVSQQTHNAQAPWYVVVGGAGCEEGLSRGYDKGVPWAAHWYDDGYGAGVIETLEDDVKQLHVAYFKFIRASDGVIEDSFTLTKDY